MTLQEIYNKYPEAQIVLSFSNNNDVLVTSECFDTQSKFYRRSKVRLGVDFVMTGIIDGDTFIKTEDDSHYPKAVLIYRTYRGGNLSDYILYIFTGEYKILQHIKKKVNYKRVMSQSRQLTLNSLTKPVPDKVLDICPHIDKKHYFVSYRSNGLKSGIHYGPLYKNTLPYDYLGYYLGVLVGLTVAKKYADKITQVRIFHPDEEYAKGIYMFPLKKWKPKNVYTQDYVKQIYILKQELQELGISICFMK